MRQAEQKQIINATSADVICERVLIADHPVTRMRGLLGRRALPAGEGLLLTPAPSIHTAFMRFVIDAALLDSELLIVKLVPELRPWRAAGARGARAVLELADGEIARHGLRLGDRLEVRTHVLSTDANPGPELGPRRPARVLVVAADRRFRTLASAALARRGYHVTARTGVADNAEFVVRERVDVAVIDATWSLTIAAREAAKLQTVRPVLGIVAVSDDPQAGLSAFPVLPRWGSFGSLCAAIEEARGDRRPGFAGHADR